MGCCQDWLYDGTFDITPTLSKQLFSIHVVYKGIIKMTLLIKKLPYWKGEMPALFGNISPNLQMVRPNVK